MKRCLLAALLLLWTSMALAQVQPTLQKIRSTGSVTVGARQDALPFSYLDASKKPIGYGIEICNEIVARLKTEMKLPSLRVDYVPVTGATRWEVVRTGKADLECGLSVNNVERRKDAGYALPYFFAGLRILTKASSGIKDFSDLSGKKVVTAKGANAVPILRKRIDEGRLRNAQLVETANYEQSFAMLEKGEADALVTIDNLLYAYRATAAKPQDYIVTGDFLVLEAVAIVLRKDDVEFKKAVDRTLAGMMIDGLVGRLYTKWFLAPIPPNNVALGIPMSPLLRDQLRWPSDRTGDDYTSN
ncbi:MAG TPA: amino acid ABC transporter substrate-binding protein [Burkholderiaceae bacterium]|jgi:glutamate/aspartate transport system substrate-binding protein|nr:amino acid ABC transporter substrate-binding protein [Burkholderiaceae bacterium]